MGSNALRTCEWISITKHLCTLNKGNNYAYVNAYYDKYHLLN